MTKLRKLFGRAPLAGIVTEVTMGAFTMPGTLDFESSSPGAIANNHAIFSTIGIASVSGVASTFLDDFQDRQNSSDRALWLTTGNQLVIVDPENAGSNIYRQLGISYTIDFAAPVSRFGFSTHDEPLESQGAPPLAITFSTACPRPASCSPAACCCRLPDRTQLGSPRLLPSEHRGIRPDRSDDDGKQSGFCSRQPGGRAVRVGAGDS